MLHLAAIHGHSDIAALLLQHGATVDKAYFDANTALHYAAMYGHLDVVKVLVEHGSEAMMQSNSSQYTPLRLALLNHHPYVARFLLEAEQGASLFVAVESDDDQYLEAFKRESVSTQVIDPYTGNTALHEAVRMQKDECVTPLLHEDLIEQKNLKGNTPLDLALAGNNRFIIGAFGPHLLPALIRAIDNNNPALVTAILKTQQVTLNEKDDVSGEVPLHFAARKGYSDIIVELLKAEANTMLMDDQGLTPAEVALNQNHQETLRLLLDADNGSVWFSASRNGKCGRIERLLNAGAPVNRVDTEKRETALHKAAKYGHIDVVSLLLDKGANKHLKNHNRKTACQLARSGGYLEIVELLDEPLCNLL